MVCPLYFEAAAVITTIVLIGQILEQRAHSRTDARHPRSHGPCAEERPSGPPGPRGGRAASPTLFPVIFCGCAPERRFRWMGAWPRGASNVDESMLTGEPGPVTKGAGDAVSGGHA